MNEKHSTTPRSITTGHVRGSVFLVAGRVLAILINFGVQVVTVRYLSKADYGIFAFALSVAAATSVLTVFGMDKAVSRFLPVYLQQRDFGRFWGTLWLISGTVAGLGLLVVLALLFADGLGLAWLAGEARTRVVLAIIGGLVVCSALDALFISLFAVLASPAAIFFRRHLLGPLLKLLAAAVVAFSGGNVYAFAAGQLVAAFAGLAASFVVLAGILRHSSDLRQALSEPFVFPVRSLFAYSATLLSGDLGYLLRSALVPIVLGMLFVGEEVAEYQSVVPLARLNQFVLLTFAILFLPNAAKLAASEKNAALQLLFEKTTVWVTLLTFPIFASTFLASEFLPVLLFGQQYRSSAEILAWLTLGFFVNASFGTNLRLLRASGKLRVLLVADVLLMILALILVFGLVPRYGAVGGAWAVFGMYCAQAVTYVLLNTWSTTVNPLAWRCLAPFFVGVALCVAGDRLRHWLAAPPALGLLVAAVVSVIVLAAFGRQLDVPGTFPELAKLPVLRNWMLAAHRREVDLRRVGRV